MTIADKTFTVTQEGISCTYTISPASNSFTPSGGTGTIAVTAGSGCSWTAASNASFIAITFGSTGSGNGSVFYSVSSNTGVTPRTGTLTVAGKTFTVTQDGISCTYAISPAGQSFTAAGGKGTVTVTAASACTWTATTDSSFINITSGGSGSGNGTVNYEVAPNSSQTQRTGILTIASQTFTVTQEGAPWRSTYWRPR